MEMEMMQIMIGHEIFDTSLSFQSGRIVVCESSTLWGGFKFVYPQTKFSQVTINVSTYLVGCAYLMPKFQS